MLVKFHKQQLTVLLFLAFAGLIMAYGMNNINPSVANVLNFELLSMPCNYITISIVVDKISVSFSALVTFVSACVFFFARWYMKDDVNYFRFAWILMSFVASMNMLVYAGSLFTLLMGWDGLGVTSFALIIYYESPESARAGFLTLLINRLGDLLIMSVMFFYALTGTTLLCNFSYECVFPMMWLLGLASLTKSAQYPFSAWLPAAMAAPTPVSALVHSSTLVTAGVYIMIRASATMYVEETLSSLFLFCGSITSLIGGLCAAQENDLKKIVAFSTLSQLGIMVFCLGLSSPSLALLHLYTHAMFKAMLFLVAGFILMQTFGVQDIRLLGGVTKNSPLLLVFLNTSAMCLMGVPFLSAYYSKHAILNLMMSSSLNSMAMMVMAAAVILSSVYMIRMLKALNWSSTSMIVSVSPPACAFRYLPCMLLFAGSLWLGWGFDILDPTYASSGLLPKTLSVVLDCLLLAGVTIGMVFNKPLGARTVYNMFYMEPFWNSLGRVPHTAFKGLKSVEYGWAEPSTYVQPVMNSLIWMNKMLTWPGKSFSYGKYGLTLFSIVALCLYLN